MTEHLTELQVGNRRFNAAEFRNEPLVYDVFTPPHVRPAWGEVTSWERSTAAAGWHWTVTKRTARYEQHILTNLRVHTDLASICSTSTSPSQCPGHGT